MKTSDGKIGAYVSVRNLFNKLYKPYGTGFGNNYVAGTAYGPGPPRIVMGTVELKF